MAVDDLSSITGMEDKHRRALARRQITTLRGLADADPDVIHRALGSFKPRPTPNQIAQWQNEARSRLDEARSGDEARGGDEERGGPDEAPVGVGEWHQIASFAVVFKRRRVGDTWEHRIEAEQTEVEPERKREVWPSWDCSPICGWMMDQFSQADSAESGGPDQDDGGQAQPAGESAGPGKPRGGLSQLRIDSATVTDAAGTSDLVTGGAPVANPPGELVAPALVVFTVSGARRGSEVQAVARLRGHGEPGRNAAEPVTVPPSGRAEFDLSQVATGQLEMTLLAWAPDCTARHVSVRLPAMRLSPGPDEGLGAG